MVGLGNRAVVPAHVLVRQLEEESVLLNLETERYFGLDATGSRMWELVTSSASIDTALEQLEQEFDVQPQILREHLDQLLRQLVENGLLTVLPADVGSIPAI